MIYLHTVRQWLCIVLVCWCWFFFVLNWWKLWWKGLFPMIGIGVYDAAQLKADVSNDQWEVEFQPSLDDKKIKRDA